MDREVPGTDADLLTIGHICGTQRDEDIAKLYKEVVALRAHTRSHVFGRKMRISEKSKAIAQAEDEILSYMRERGGTSSLTRFSQHVSSERRRIYDRAVRKLFDENKIAHGPGLRGFVLK